MAADPKPTRCPSRVFLGWQTPLAEGVAREILKVTDKSGIVDLGDHLVIVPSALAKRLIQEALARQSPRGVLLPRIETASRFVNRGGNKGVASEADNLMAWLKVLVGLDCSRYPTLFPTCKRGERLDHTDAVSLAQTLISLREELGASPVAPTFKAVSQLEAIAEKKRWGELAKLEDELGDALGKDLEDAVASRVRMAKEGPAPDGIRHLWVAAVPDLPPLLIPALERLGATIPCHVLIGAGEEDAAAFDAWGRPVTAAWLERCPEWKDFARHVHLVGNPAEGLRRVELILGETRPVAGLQAIVACDRLADTPRLAATLRSMGSEAANPLGRPHGGHLIHQTLSTWAGLLGKDEPDFRWLQKAMVNPLLARSAAGLAGKSFSLANRAMSVAEGEVILGRLGEMEKEIRRLCAMARKSDIERRTKERLLRMEALPETIGELRRAREKLLKKGDWHAALEHMIKALRSTLMRQGKGAALDDFSQDVITSIQEAGEAHRKASAGQSGLKMSHEQHIRLVLAGTAAQRFSEPENEQGISLPSWADAPWEAAPHLVIFGLNDEVVPRATTADAFLPAQLRRLVELGCDEEALAQAAFGLEQIRRQREASGRLDVVVPQRDGNGDPRRPSRILFLGPDSQLADRVLHLFKESPENEAQPYWEIPQEQKFAPARTAPEAELKVKKISATQFKHYLGNPTEFWLRQKLEMDSPRPASLEMGAAAFGTLIHAVLEDFGKAWLGKGPDETAELSAEKIERELQDYLKAHVARFHGEQLGVALELQVEMARKRLSGFARVQAGLFRSAEQPKNKPHWTIMAVEGKLPELELEITLGDKKEKLVVGGRFDRLDHCVETKEWRVYDYKTFGSKATPSSKHLRGGKRAVGSFVSQIGDPKKPKKPKAWIDLQLPVYAACLAKGLKLPGKQTLEEGTKVIPAYFCITANPADTDVKEWEDYHALYHTAAVAQINAVAKKILTGDFLPEDNVPDYPLLPGMAGRRMEEYMDLGALKGGAR